MRHCKKKAITRQAEEHGWKCNRPGWVFGYCFSHALWRLRWEWRVGPLTLAIDLGGFNWPQIMVDSDRPIQYVAFTYGNDGSDPAIRLEWSR